nr:DUF2974 domain-containing protein [Bifidobacterium choloepi]
MDYVKDETRDFTEYPFHAPDALVFALLSYDRIPGQVPRLARLEERYGTLGRRVKSFNPRHPFKSVRSLWSVPYDGVTLRHVEEELAEHEALDPDYDMHPGLVDPRIAHSFYRSTSRNPRFAVCEMNAADEQFDEDRQTQFAAVTFRLPTDTLVIAFRGTDDSLVGWREDFNMSFQYPVPAQREAADYLDRVADFWPGRIVLTGHSKGGNLAIYAAMNARDDVKDRIEQIYSLDGPGFQQPVIASYEYSTVADRVTKIVPEYSIIGMLLEAPKDEHRIVVTSSVDGLMQHSGFTWQMRGDRFNTVPDVAESSRTFNAAVNAWLSGMTQRQREHAVKALFRVLESSGQANVSGLMSGGLGVLPGMVGSYVGLNGEERKYINQAMRLLATAAFNHSPSQTDESNTDDGPTGPQ